MIAYVNGTFSTGQLVMVRSDNSSLFPIELAQDAGGDNFDGNPDWAPDGRPECPDSTVEPPSSTRRSPSRSAAPTPARNTSRPRVASPRTRSRRTAP